MFFFACLHAILSFSLVAISIQIVNKYLTFIFLQFTNIDSLYIKEGKYEQINDNNKKYFYCEIGISTLLSISALITHSKLISLLSLGITIYNYYILLTGKFKLDFILGDTKYNQRSYYQESLKYKIKFIIYISICSLSFIILFMRILYVILDKLLNEKEILYDIFKYFNIYEEKH